MQIFDKGKIYNFMKFRYAAFAFSAILMLGSMFLLFFQGFNYGIDFSGGTLIQVKYDQKADLALIRKTINKVDFLKDAAVTEFGSDREIVIRYSSAHDKVQENLNAKMNEILKPTGNFEIRRVDVVGPKVGDDLKQKGIMAVAVSLVLILIYIAVRFEWRFAIAAIFSEFHDIIITIGAIILFKIDFNLEILAAILTILGYSLNDTIIVFDRIREGIKESKFAKINDVINEAVSATLSRTILTSFTTLISVAILLLFGGDMIYNFSFVMMIGIVFGTFSSTFIAAQSLIWFKFNVNKYREFLAEKQRKIREKEKIRAMYEKGTI